MSNSFNIDVKPEISANLVQILSNASALATIQITDLPKIVDEIDANQVFIEAIIDTQLPNIATQNTNIKSVVDANKTAVDAILEDTAALPQNVRGKFKEAFLSTESGTAVDVLNVTGQGKLCMLSARCYDSADTLQVRLVIDGLDDWETHTGDVLDMSIILKPYSAYAIQLIPESDVRNKIINLEFDTSLHITIHRSAGSAGNVSCSVYYTLDAF